MKRLLSVLPVLLLASCLGGDAEPGGTARVRFSVCGGSETLTRSSVGAPEDGINSLLMLFYENGSLLPALTVSRDAGGSDSLAVEVSLGIGHDYEVVAFANCSLSQIPQTYSAAMELCYTCDGIDCWSDGVPMACSLPLTVHYGVTSVRLQLVRLVAKLNLTIDTSPLQHGSIRFTSIAVRQMNCRCPFFGPGAASGDGGVCDGDLASPDDLQSINARGAGYQTSFYLLENRQGDILPLNQNPDNKVPQAVTDAGGDPGLCTYLEILGTYSDCSGHLTSDSLAAHLFLGFDALGNFDLVRNCRYDVMLRITDDGCLRTDWKINGYLEDKRTLVFTPQSLKAKPSQAVTPSLNTNLSYAAGDYAYSLSGDTNSFTVEPLASGVRVTPASTVLDGKSVTVTARTWDGALTTSCTVTAEVEPRFIIEGEPVLYIGQRGVLHITDRKGTDLTGRTQLDPGGFCATVEGSGSTWYVNAVESGIDYLMLLVDNWVVGGFHIEVLTPQLQFPSDSIMLPLDGAGVECGPYYCRSDGTRLNYSDFDPGLYESLLRFTLTRDNEWDLRGKYWGEHGASGSPAVAVRNVGIGEDSYEFRLDRFSYGGRAIWENYDFAEGDAGLEYIKASVINKDIRVHDAQATLYTRDPFAPQGAFRTVESDMLADWPMHTGHDETLNLYLDGLVTEGNDYGCASACAVSGSGNLSFAFEDESNVRMTIPYDTYGAAAAPPYETAVALRMTNRNSGEIYQSWKRYAARCRVNLAVGGIASENSTGGSDISLQWSFPRPLTEPFLSLEDIVVGTGGSGSNRRGMYNVLYSLNRTPSAVRNNYYPSYEFCRHGASADPSNYVFGDSYQLPEYQTGDYRFMVWRYSVRNSSSRGWLDR